MEFPVGALLTACGILLSTTWYFSLNLTQKALEIYNNINDDIVKQINYLFYLPIKNIILLLCSCLLLLISYSTNSTYLMNYAIAVSYMYGFFLLKLIFTGHWSIYWQNDIFAYMKKVLPLLIRNIISSTIGIYVFYLYFTKWEISYDIKESIIIIWFFLTLALVNFIYFFLAFPSIMTFLKTLDAQKNDDTDISIPRQRRRNIRPIARLIK